MKPTIPAILFSILWILGGSYFFSTLLCPAAAAGAATTNLSVIDGAWKATSTGNFAFPMGASEISITKDAQEKVFTKTGAYLQENGGKMLALTGIYGVTEKNKTDFANLGIARAEAVKEVLVKNGANPDQITTVGEERPKLGFIDRKLYNGVEFAFSTNEAAAAIGSTLNFDESQTLYFEQDQVDFSSEDAKLMEIMEYLESYMATNPDAVVTVNGYTDNQGSSSDKMKIAKKRVERVRRIIRSYKKGKVFSSKQVVRNAVGPQDPQADNETPEGIAINNRVTITVE